MSHADLVLVNGSVITVDPRDRVAEGVAVVDGRIAAVGAAGHIRSMAGPGTRVIDLRGGAVIPGINDSHLHALGLGLARPPMMLDVTFPAVRSIADIVAALRAEAARVPPGTWIRGRGWDVGYLDECRTEPGRLPTRHDLDAATTEHPVVLEELWAHSSWANTRALREAGIDAATSSPPGSVIVREPGGEPSGVFREFGAQALLFRAMPAVTLADRRRAVRGALDILTPLGITSFTDPALGPGGDQQLGGAFHSEGIDVYAELAAAGDLRARVNVLLLFGAPHGTAGAGEIEEGLRAYRPPPDVDPAWLRIAGVKIFADGIPPSRTSWVSQPYEGTTDQYGSLVVHGADDAERSRELDRMVALIHAAGYQVGVHATGDRAVDAVVAAYVAARRSGGDPDPRHYVIHGDFLSPWALATMARLRVGLNPQPAIQWTLSGVLPESVGEQRTQAQWPLRTVLDAGVPLALSSDAPVMDPDWRRGVASAALRESKATGRVVGARHRITVLDALRAYTLGGAWQDHAEDWKGSIEVGKVADLCVLGADPLAVDPHEVVDVPVRATILGGDVIHENW